VSFPLHGDTTLVRVIERVQQQILREPQGLYAIAFDVKHVRSGGVQKEITRGRKRAHRFAQLTQHRRGIERIQVQLILACIQARKIDEVG
jgi:hypothetical protein